jgi:NAD(P)-dependent dehydrogenase (short-subunit alcohol dehydrogenase family)
MIRVNSVHPTQVNTPMAMNDVTETFFGASPRLQSGDSRSRLLVRVADRVCRRWGLS